MSTGEQTSRNIHRRRARCRSLAMVGAAAVLVAGAFAGSAGPAPKPDTTSPGNISNVQLLAAPRGLAITFTATGDDGGSGRAQRYRSIAYVHAGTTAQCAPLPSSGWDDLRGLPRTAGTLDSVAWSALDASTPYCVGLEVVDDAGNRTRSGPYGPYLTAGAGAGGWSLTQVSDLDLPRTPVPEDADRPIDFLLPDTTPGAEGKSMIVRIHEGGVFIANADTSFAQRDAGVSSAGTSTTAQATVNDRLSAYTGLYQPGGGVNPAIVGAAAIPGGGVAIYVGAINAAGAVVPLFLEYRDGEWSVTELPWNPASANSDGSGLWRRSLGGVSILYMDGNPILTYTEVSGTSTHLYLAQRTNGVWPVSGTRLLTRQKTRSNVSGPTFSTGALVDASAGGFSRLGLWVNVSLDGAGGFTNGVYLVRCNAAGDPFCVGSPDGWVWYDTGNTGGESNAFYDLAGVDQNGMLRIVNVPGTGNAVQTIGQADFQTKFLGLAGAATSRLARTRTTIYAAGAEINGLTFIDGGYQVDLRTGTGGMARSAHSLLVCGNTLPLSERVTYVSGNEGSRYGGPVNRGPVISLFAHPDGVLLARRTQPACPP